MVLSRHLAYSLADKLIAEALDFANMSERSYTVCIISQDPSYVAGKITRDLYLPLLMLYEWCLGELLLLLQIFCGPGLLV